MTEKGDAVVELDSLAPKRARGRVVGTVFALALVSSILSLPTSCIADRPRSCASQSDCVSATGSQGQICGLQGFCVNECLSDSDCPCGSFCAGSCGVCIRLDVQGPASCFAYGEGLGTNDVLGACRGSTDAGVHVSSSTVVQDGAADAAPADAGACMLSQPICSTSPPLDGGDTLLDATTSDADAIDADIADSALSDGATDGSEGGK